MQGGSVEHATVLASVRDVTKGWSYTALSRARGQTHLHIDASDMKVALERSELGGVAAAQINEAIPAVIGREELLHEHDALATLAFVYRSAHECDVGDVEFLHLLLDLTERRDPLHG